MGRGSSGQGRRSSALADNAHAVFDPLFGPNAIDQVFNLHRKRASDLIATLPADEIRTANLGTLEADFVELRPIEPLALRWEDKAEYPGKDLSDVDHDGADRTPPATATGEFILVVPYSGTPELFHLRPTRHGGRPPRGFVWQSQGRLKYSVARGEPATVRRALQHVEAAIRRWVRWVNSDVDSFNADFQRFVHDALAARLDTIRAHDDLVAALGVPQAPRESPPAPRDGPRHPGLVNRRGPRVADSTEVRDATGQSAPPPGAGARKARRGGRPKGTRYLTLPEVLKANRELDVDAAAGKLKAPNGGVRRYVRMEDLADKTGTPIGTLRDLLRDNGLIWAQREAWPSE